MFKAFAKSMATMIVGSTVVLASNEGVDRFEKDWKNPLHTQMTLKNVDINHVLSTYYTTDKPLHFTRTMLWDLECKKAWDPQTYIAHVVSEGRSWGKKDLGNGETFFLRFSKQKQWISGDYADVLEKVYIIDKDQKVVFIGVSEMTDESGRLLQTKNPQPLFHVEHGIAGTEDQPLVTWRIVHLTAGKDNKLIERFAQLDMPTTLPPYIEVYIKKDLKIDLKKK